MKLISLGKISHISQNVAYNIENVFRQHDWNLRRSLC